jgi:predicted phage terminase large subunit-like protein
MDSTGTIVIVQTRWTEDDLVGRLIDPMNPYYNADEAKTWRKIDLPALAEENDILGRKEGEPLWPERFTKSYLEDIRATDPRGFAALYQGRPSPKEGAFFRSEDLVPYNKMDAMPAWHKLRFYGASDHAVSTDRVADKTCLIVVGVDEKDNIWVMPDSVWGKYDTHQTVEAMISLMKKYKPQFWWAEGGSITKSIGPFLRRRMVEKQVFCAIDPINPAADKQQRAQAIQARSSMKMVHFPAFTRWWPDAQDQILKFPHGAKDDFVDALALIGLGLAKMHGRTRNKPPEPEIKTGTFRELFAQTRQREGYDRRARSLQGW